MKAGERTRKRILDAGIKLWPDVTFSNVAREIDLTHSAIMYHYEDAKALKRAVAEHAVEQENSRVIVQLIGQNHPLVSKLSNRERNHHFSAV